MISEVFEFTAGGTAYLAELARYDDDTFELGFQAAEDLDVVPQPRRQTARPNELDALLSSLPVALLKIGSDGTVEFATGEFLGCKPEDLVGRHLRSIIPDELASTFEASLDASTARETLEAVVVRSPSEGDRSNWLVTLSREDSDIPGGLLVAGARLPETVAHAPEASESSSVRGLEEEVWSSAVRISELEAQLDQVVASLAAIELARQRKDDEIARIVSRLRPGLRTITNEVAAIAQADVPASAKIRIEKIRSSADELTEALGTSPEDLMSLALTEDDSSKVERFSIPTLLDEIVVGSATGQGAHLNVHVQASLPVWLVGDAHTARTAIERMTEIALLVSRNRVLTVAAHQEASEGRSIRVRFEVEIPSPPLDEQSVELIRGCLEGDLSDVDPNGSLDDMFRMSKLPDIGDLKLTLAVTDAATVLRYATSFEIADEQASNTSWVRGLRTLIIQDPDHSDDGLQASLATCGIIGYVVSDESKLVEALRIAEDLSNPYRFVIADVDTPHLESFVTELFRGDAPVVLVGEKSEAAMLGALSAGYDGYLAKPVRQMDLLEVILSTVEPPDYAEEFGQVSNAA